MPQVDKATFLPIVFWTFVIYLSAFLYLNSTVLYTFLSSLKLIFKRAFAKSGLGQQVRRMLSSVLVFPLLSL